NIMIKLNIKLSYNSILTAILIFVLCLIISGASVYYFYNLNKLGVELSIVLAIIFSTFFAFINKKFTITTRHNLLLRLSPIKKLNFVDFTLILSYLLCLITNFYLLYSKQTTESIVSPWQVVSGWFFFGYGLTGLILLVLIFRDYNTSANNSSNKNFLIFLISAFYFLSFSVAWITYKIGYGFDPFIHRATMELIDKTGSVDPKPLYYLGQYSLIVIAHKLTSIPIIWLDKLLVPFFAALFLPMILYKVLAKWFLSNRLIPLLSLSLLILPYSFFIVTTPQSLAYLFLLLAILLGIACANIADLLLIYLLALATLTIQPLAGLPTLLFAILLTIFHTDNSKIKKYSFWLISAITVIILPLVFYFLEKTLNTGQSGNLENSNIWPKFIFPNQDNFIFNFIYLYGFNIGLIFACLILTGLILAYRHKNNCRILKVYFIMASALLLSYFITKKIAFSFLINYERNDFSSRILLISIFFLLPFILITLHYLLHKLLQQNFHIKIIWSIFLILLLTTSIYLSYPRFDRFYNSRGYTVSNNDIKAVQWIENNKTDKYIVLANQQVSAAALREFGFNHYYKNNIFYYPIPTGGPLYKYYLDMVYQTPSKETMKQAMDLAGVNQGFFVLNKYWNQFSKILEEAKLSAKSWQKINNGEVYVFEY
ncbi:hypothetical protein KKA77_01285, partial [Patescibacteria group bacterium]|nr:hypothetical protein [Patescibacteria group bacterium]